MTRLYLLVLLAAAHVLIAAPATGQVGGRTPFLQPDSAVADSACAKEKPHKNTLPVWDLRSWHYFGGEEDATCFWNQKPTDALSGAGISGVPSVAGLTAEPFSAISGSWRFALGLTGSASNAADDPTSRMDNFQRFVTGGGNVMIGAERPIMKSVHSFSSAALLLTSRAFFDIPRDTGGGSTQNAGNAEVVQTGSNSRTINRSGQDGGARFVYQRFGSDHHRILTLDFQGGAVRGSRDLLTSLGRANGHAFLQGSTGVYLHLLHMDIGARQLFGPKGYIGNKALQLVFNMTPEEKAEPANAQSQLKRPSPPTASRTGSPTSR